MADHQLRQRGLAERDLVVHAQPDPAQRGERGLRVLARPRRTAARGLDETGAHQQAAVAGLGDRAHKGVFVNAHAGLDVGAAAGRREREDRRNRRRVVVDDQVELADMALRALRHPCARAGK